MTLYVITANHKKLKINNISKDRLELIIKRIKFIFGQETVIIPKEA